MNFIRQYLNLFSGSILNEYYVVIGDRIMSRKKGSTSIEISVNKAFNLKWGALFILIAIGMFLFFTKNMLESLNFTRGLIIASLSLPFLGMGIIYLFKTRSKHKIEFNLSIKKMTLNGKRRVSFTEINEMNLTKIEGFDGPTSFQLNLIVKGKEITIFRNEDYNEMNFVAMYLSRETGIKLSQYMEYA